MKIIFFKQPKKTILNILYVYSLLMLGITLVAIVTVFMWMEYPHKIPMIERHIPNYHENKIEDLYKKAKKSSSELEQYKNFTLLYEELNYGITSLHKYYRHHSEAGEYIVDYLIRNNQLQKAIKFQYGKVLALVDKNEAKEYFEKLYKRHGDIREVYTALQYFLVKNGFINEAILLENERTLRMDNILFSVYFIDGNKNAFSGKQTRRVASENVETQSGKKHSIVFRRDYKKFKGIRLDIDSLESGRQFEILDIILIAKGKKYQNIKIKHLNHIKTNPSNRYVISGVDPYLILSIPDDLKHSTGGVDLLASVMIYKDLGVKRLLINNKEWQFFHSQSQHFKQGQSQKLLFSFMDDNVIEADLMFTHADKSRHIRVDLPSFHNLKIKSINVLVNGATIVGRDEVSFMHAIIKNKKGYMVNGDDPYIVYRLSDKEVINKISVRVEF